MARIRSVHPDICLSETMAGLPAHLERTFVRLWTHCDDEGRCVDNPRLIKAAIYPLHDDIDWIRVDRELTELEEYGLIVRYEVDGVGVVQVWSWSQYQKPQRPTDSKLPPAPSDTRPRVVREGSQQLLVPLHAGEGEGEGVGEGVGAIAPKPARDEVWDTLSELFGEPTTRSNRSLRGRLVKSLTSAGATGDDIRLRFQAWPFHFEKATLTETALEKHWDRLGRPVNRAATGQVERLEGEMRRHQRELQAREADARGLPG